jgi:curved DNA-binding protein CbpA
VVPDKEKRRFKRYSYITDFQISIGEKTFQACLKDFSLNGVCFTIKDAESINSATNVNIKIDELNMVVQGKVVWTKKNGSDLIVGVERNSISGFLKYFPLSDILLDLQRSGKTGVLEIRNGGTCKKIYIQNGDIIFAASNLEEDRIGEVLIKCGKLTLEQYFHSLDVMKKTGKRHGTVLVELGYIKPAEIFGIVTNHVEEIILGLFRWKDGKFVFKEGPLPSQEVITLKISAANLIYRGCKRIDTITQIINNLPSLNSILYFSEDPLNLFQDIKLYERDNEILSLIDGKRTIREILSLSPLNNFQTMKTIYALISARMIEINEKENNIIEDKIREEILKEDEEVVLDSSFVQKTEELYERLPSINYYELLEVTKWSQHEEIKRAYYRKAKEFHPDRHFYLTSDTLKNKLNDIFSTLTIAYKTLSDPVTRKEYDEILSSKTLNGESSNRQIAKAKFEEGRIAFNNKLYSEAATLFGQAVYLDGSVPEYHFHLGLALKNDNKLHEAEASINNALKLEPFNAIYLAELGNIYLKLGLNLRAKTIFEKAIKFDPYNQKATEGLNCIECQF